MSLSAPHPSGHPRSPDDEAAAGSASQHDAPTAAPSRLALVDAVRALASTLIAWHHFVIYGPLADLAIPVSDPAIDALRNFRWAAQVFFVVGGYVMARSLMPRIWTLRGVGKFVARRYCRLGLPYLAACAMALAACSAGRGWLPNSVVGAVPTWGQIIAHVFFLQNILGYESLSAGLWFVCIDFQLGLIFVAALYLRDAGVSADDRAAAERRWKLLAAAGWLLAAASLFYFNLDDRWDCWAIYFFGQFFLGVMLYQGLHKPGWRVPFWLYIATFAASLVYDWRWRLAVTLAIGLLIYAGTRLGFAEQWPRSRIAAYLGRTSYSLFLIHFPVLVAVATACERYNLLTRVDAIAGLVMAYIVSLLVADVFFRFVESPAERLSQRLT